MNGERRAAVSLAIVLGIVATWFVFTRTGDDVAAAQASLDANLAQYESDRTLVAQLPQRSVQYARLWNTVRGFTVGKDGVSALMAYLDAVARRRHVRLESLTFPTVHDTPASNGVAPLAPRVTPTATPGLFREQPCSLVLEGSYTALLFALADLSRGPVLLQITQPPAMESTNDALKMTVAATLLESTAP